MTKRYSATLNPSLRPFWETPARNRVLYGGRSSSKSWDAAGRAIGIARMAKVRFLCTRQFQSKIEESVYTLLKLQIERFGFRKEFDILQNKITHKRTGAEFIFYGIYRSIDEIKSMENVDVLWIEEAHNLTKEQWEILEPTIRKEHSEIWIIFNPRLATDFVYKRFVVNPPPNTLSRLINYTENPFLSKTILDIINNLKEEDFDEYEHIYLGVPKLNDDAVIIKRSWIMAAIDAHLTIENIKAEGRRSIGFDVADSGADKCANVFAHGPVVSWADMWKASEDELLKSCTRTHSKARELNADIVYDSIGVGAASGAKFNELNLATPDSTQISYAKFNAGAGVEHPESFYKEKTKNKDMFSNLKAQTWWGVGDRFMNTFNAVKNGQKFKDDELISISSDCPFLENIIDELSTPKKDYDNNGKVKVESKKDLAKREIPSPNLADAFVMNYAPKRAPGFFGM